VIDSLGPLGRGGITGEVERAPEGTNRRSSDNVDALSSAFGGEEEGFTLAVGVFKEGDAVRTSCNDLRDQD
jgi:hypothetical protein